MEANVTDQNKSIDDQDCYLLQHLNMNQHLTLVRAASTWVVRSLSQLLITLNERTSPPCFNNSL